MKRILLLNLIVWRIAGLAAAAEPVDYLTEIKPILARRCAGCHGALKQESSYRVDTADFLRRGGDGGPAVVPGEAANSSLVQAIRGIGERRMPAEGEPLEPREIALVERWIDEGAQAPDEEPPPDPRAHWSFQKPVRPTVPMVRNAAWAMGPIDAFIADKHAQLGLEPRPVADRHVLLRRVYLDLVGIPPTRAELHAFLLDTTPDAWEKVVDRLMASPGYGERWGRHWMDVWRYSDWAGYGAEVRESKPHIWRWRDWIVDSLNQDKPYDRMVLEMLAADEIAPEDDKALAATGFLARNWYLFNRNVWLDNTVEHTAKAFLGITLNCARCHDHMYDPIPQTDYYRFRAFFEPHDVRVDRLPGQADLAKDGLARVYDANAAALTFLFSRGDEEQPVKDQPLAPGVPEVLGSDRLAAAVAVPLAPAAYYAGIKPYIRSETIAAASAQVELVQATLKEKRQALAQISPPPPQAVAAGATAGAAPATSAGADGADPKSASEPAVDKPGAANPDIDAAVKRATQEVELASKACATAEANLLFQHARIAADQARFADPPDPNANVLALAAARAEKFWKLAAAEENVALAQSKLAVATAARMPEDPKTQKGVDEAQGKLAESQKGLEAARGTLAESTATYSPIDTIYPSTSTGRRTALARWIVDRDNPLAARVAVNHVWMRHFGRPLVEPTYDLGRHGHPPTHPELLDWLAVEFMESGWSMKKLHRLLVTSQAYRMASTVGAGEVAGVDASRAADPDNRFLWRMNPRRLEAEIVRDSVLAVSGQLDPTMGGPDLDPAQGLASGRRSLYFRHAKEKQMVFLGLFDAASVTECYRRDESVTPQQGLALANSTLALTQARRLARTLSDELQRAGDVGDASFVAAAFERMLCRQPTGAERNLCEAFLQEQAQALDRPDPEGSGSGTASEVPPSPDPGQRARENLVVVLFNHHDFLTIH